MKDANRFEEGPITRAAKLQEQVDALEKELVQIRQLRGVEIAERLSKLLQGAPDFRDDPDRYFLEISVYELATAYSTQKHGKREAETVAEQLQMLLVNLNTAACPYAHDPDASEALLEAHREVNAELDGFNCNGALKPA